MKIFYLFVFFYIFLIDNVIAQIYGCTDSLSLNYNSSATINDGSCTYKDSSVSPISSLNLSTVLKETSGLINWNDRVWTHNDNGDINLYSLDALNGNIIQIYPLDGTINNNWEEISQDSKYVYVGDFGNNTNGNRTDLKILRIEKNSLLINAPIIDTINYTYSDQINFNPAGSNNTDFDCEAFIVSSDSIYLFSKQWISYKTSVYSLPKKPGTYIANLKTTFNVEGLVTGSVFLESKKIVALCGYNILLQPFIYLLYDFKDFGFFNGNKRKISISLPFYQFEGIATTDGLFYYLSNELFYQPPIINNIQKLHIFDLSYFLSDYLNSLTINISESISPNKIGFYPNPVKDIITVEWDNLPTNYYLLNSTGQTVLKGILYEGNSSFNMTELPKGIYFLKIGNWNNSCLKVLKR